MYKCYTFLSFVFRVRVMVLNATFNCTSFICGGTLSHTHDHIEKVIILLYLSFIGITILICFGNGDGS